MFVMHRKWREALLRLCVLMFLPYVLSLFFLSKSLVFLWFNFRFPGVYKVNNLFFFPGWAHVVCALYIQEVSFGDMAALEPIIVTNVPKERFKQTCSICTERQQNHLAGQGAVICYNRWFIVG